jgi:hypothetical protein
MVVNDTHRFVFVSTPKAGTHSMFAFLSERYGTPRGPRPFHGRIVPPEAAGYFTFAVVRNPFSRAVSCWWHLLFREGGIGYRSLWRPVVGGVGFREFMEWLVANQHNPPHYRGDVVLFPQHVWLDGVRCSGRRVEMDAVLHLERIEREFAALPFADGPVRIPRRLSNNASAEISDYGDWREIMTDETADLVRTWAGEDFARYGYDTDWRKA